METLTTKGIKVSVKVQYQSNQSRPVHNQYVFAYQIIIENKSPETVQLLRRHWHIFDSCGMRREVEGDGVIGKQPILRPGESHRYTSWCPLFSGLGKMHGTYLMERQADQTQFEVGVPVFHMVAPSIMN
ncbi:MAG: Co2+/Mg2+ efflux protein ApaG [Bacteroidota bacterium]